MNNENLKKAIEKSVTWSGTLRELGLPLTSGNFEKIKKCAHQYELDSSHFVGKNHPRKYTKEVLQDAVSKSRSYKELFEALNAKWSGGLHDYLKKRIAEYSISTEHFCGKSINNVFVRNNPFKKRGPGEILCQRAGGRRTLSYMLRRALVESGRAYCCSECGVSEWNGKDLVLQVHHINGNSLDDTPGNLKFLCPNCHSQTEGWCHSKGLTGITSKNKSLSE